MFRYGIFRILVVAGICILLLFVMMVSFAIFAVTPDTLSLLPLVVLRMLWRSRRAPAYRRRLAERFGLFSAPPAGPTIWVHAVSVGEVQAAEPLIRALATRFPDRALMITTVTPTGAARVEALFGDSVTHCYIPVYVLSWQQALQGHET